MGFDFSELSFTNDELRKIAPIERGFLIQSNVALNQIWFFQGLMVQIWHGSSKDEVAQQFLGSGPIKYLADQLIC